MAARKSPRRGTKVKPSKDVIYVVGHARLPSETAAKHVYEVLSLGLLLDKETKTILEVSSTILPPYGNEFIRNLLLGKRLEEDLGTIIKEIHSRLICRSKKALLAALDDLLKRLREHEKRA